MDWLRLAGGELGDEWIDPTLFRIGASTLLGALRDRLCELASDGA